MGERLTVDYFDFYDSADKLKSKQSFNGEAFLNALKNKQFVKNHDNQGSDKINAIR